MKKKNILLITTDQQRPDTIAALGADWMITPNLDKLVKSGISFSRAYCGNPMCMPSRASIITGNYPSRHQAWTNGVCLPENTKTMAHAFSDNGYFTKCIGKMHFQSSTGDTSEGGRRLTDWDYLKKWSGPYYGFQEAELSASHGDESQAFSMHYGLWLKENGISDEYFQLESKCGANPEPWGLPMQYCQESWVAKRTIDTLDNLKDKDKPFFIWSSLQGPHCPWVVPNGWENEYKDQAVPETIPISKTGMNDVYQKTIKGKFDETGLNEEHMVHCCQYSHALNTLPIKDQNDLRRVYHSQVSLIDHYIGEIVDYLKENNLIDDTIIVFTTDHGDFHGDHGLWGKGIFHYDSTIRVPVIVSCPSIINPDNRSDALISLIDLFPTLSSLAGVNLEEKHNVQGIDQSAICLGKKDSLRDACLIEDRGNPGRCDVKTIITSQYRFSYWSYRNWGEIYDLKNDPNEVENLWDRKETAEIQKSLYEKMLEVLTERERPLKKRKYPV